MTIMFSMSDDEARMVIAALGYVRHPHFIELAERIQLELWSDQADRANPYEKDTK